MHTHHVLEMLEVRMEEVFKQFHRITKGVGVITSALAIAGYPAFLGAFRSPPRAVTSSGFGSEEVTNRQRSHFIHSTLVNLEGRSHPAAARALLTPPAKGAQLRRAFGTQKLQEKQMTPLQAAFGCNST